MSILAVVIVIICIGLALYIKFVALDINPLKLAERYVSKNMINEAIDEYKKLLNNDPYNVFICYKLGDLYLKRKLADEGVECFKKIINIGDYNQDISKHDVFKKLAKAHLLGKQIDEAFELYCDILHENPNDEDALSQVGFLSLGQEMFDIAYKTFEKLLKTKKLTFEVCFAAGMAALQLSMFSEAIEHFKSALELSPESSIANLAAAFAFKEKNEYQQAIKYAQKVTKLSNNDASFIAERLSGILYYQDNNANSAFQLYENLLNIARNSRSEDELKMILYDMGFICIACEKSGDAMTYWNELYKLDENYKRIEKLIGKFAEGGQISGKDLLKNGSLGSFASEWIYDAFPANYIWRICGLRASEFFDLRVIYDRDRTQVIPKETFELVEKLNSLDSENLKMLAGNIVQKMGYFINETLNTYKDFDGIDFTATSPNKVSTLVWFRKWNGVNIGEIPINNFGQAIRDFGMEEGLFITSGELTPQTEELLKSMPQVKMVSLPDLVPLLSGLI